LADERTGDVGSLTDEPERQVRRWTKPVALVEPGVVVVDGIDDG
jgi:hypothetical protein